MLKFYFNIFFYVLFFSFVFSENISNTVETIPNITLKDLNKKKLKLLDIIENKFVVFNFWNMACEPCKKEMKFLNEFHNKYKNNDFKVVSINMDSPRSMSKVKKYVKSSKYEFDVLLDPRMNLFKKMGGSIMPFVIIVNDKGVITNKHVGYNLGDEVALEEEIKVLISFKEDSSIVK